MMNLDEAIKHCEEVMMENLEKTKDRNASDPIAKNCFECADEHRQLAEWLKELKAYREKLNCTDCIIDGTDACSRGAGRAVDDEICGDFIPSRSEIPNTCGDAISRRAVLNLMRGLTRWCVRSEDGKWNNVGLLYDDVMFGIDRLPSVTPQQRTGRWIKQNYGWNWQCSECGFVTPPSAKEIFTFCPKCGAKMEVENG